MPAVARLSHPIHCDGAQPARHHVGYIAIPPIAVTALHAGPGQAGALARLSTAVFLLIGLPAGAWVDRMCHRRVLILADLARAGLLVSIPLAWWLDGLTFEQLYAVILLTGGATVFYDVGSQSVLPQLVGCSPSTASHRDVRHAARLAPEAGQEDVDLPRQAEPAPVSEEIGQHHLAIAGSTRPTTQSAG
ncbi:MAG TPA: hypothetical protein VM347_42380 [Nonomuraea sp.]|nr:hypothetical protein [Nonomuraea sp.]